METIAQAPTGSDSSTEERLHPIPPKLLLVLLVFVLYGAGYLMWYGSTPLGLYPALDGAQNLELAQRLWTGTYEAGVFHRSPWYAFMLAPLWGLHEATGLSVADGARWLNWIALLLTAFFTGKATVNLWKNKVSGLIASCLILANPVILFFAGDPLDTLWASAAMSAFLYVISRDYQRGGMTISSAFVSALILGFGSAVRPVGLVLSTLWPVIVLGIAIMTRRTQTPSRIITLTVFALFGTLIFPVATGLMNLRYSGTFTSKPTGSPFILWWANSSHANGLYYYQQYVADHLSYGQNPATHEAEMHYQNLTEKPVPSIGEMNRFFMRETIRNAIENPVETIRLLSIKTYATVHNYEQYDNKSYFFHRDLSPWLHWNPLGWGILFILAAFGLVTLENTSIRIPIFALILFLLYASIIIATYPSNRFRVPLIPMLTVLSGWIPILFTKGKLSRDCLKPRILIPLLPLTLAVFFPFKFITPKDTIPSDYCLLARASHLAGQDTEAMKWASLALETYPYRSDLQRIYVISRFNSWFTKNTPPPCFDEAQLHLKEIKSIKGQTPELNFTESIYVLNFGNVAEATEIWRRLAETHQHPAAIALLSLYNKYNTQFKDPGKADAINRIPEHFHLGGFPQCESPESLLEKGKNPLTPE
ncbi:MAG: hypothetical protein JW706_04165 [Opitutales bacterium]|nr:hypothetical protein [Opitutales bacterium]